MIESSAEKVHLVDPRLAGGMAATGAVGRLNRHEHILTGFLALLNEG